MSYFQIRLFFLKDIKSKYLKKYKIDLESWLPNIYYRLKYIYICEIAAAFAYFFYLAGLSPNNITILNIILAISSLSFFYVDNENLKFIAILIFFSKQILDNLDGFIARFKKIRSLFGEKLDTFCGHLYYYCIFLSLMFHVYNHYNENKIDYNFVLVIGSISVFLDLLNFFLNKKIKNKIIKKKFSKYLYILRLINYDGRTIKTDIILFIVLIELLIKNVFISIYFFMIICLFKIIKNTIYLYKN